MSISYQSLTPIKQLSIIYDSILKEKKGKNLSHMEYLINELNKTFNDIKTISQQTLVTVLDSMNEIEDEKELNNDLDVQNKLKNDLHMKVMFVSMSEEMLDVSRILIEMAQSTKTRMYQEGGKFVNSSNYNAKNSHFILPKFNQKMVDQLNLYLKSIDHTTFEESFEIIKNQLFLADVPYEAKISFSCSNKDSEIIQYFNFLMIYYSFNPRIIFKRSRKCDGINEIITVKSQSGSKESFVIKNKDDFKNTFKYIVKTIDTPRPKLHKVIFLKMEGCSYCIKFKETWDKLIERFPNSPSLFEIIDSEEVKTKKLEKEYRQLIEGYPTILFKMNDHYVPYNLSRDIDTIYNCIQFIKPE